jgi:UTP--glucose-1-phosphate uridylyltransferase
MYSVKKVVLPVAGLGSRFFPLSKVFPKELWPLVDLPILHYIVKEVIETGIKEIIFVISPEKKIILDYFKKKSKYLEKIEKSLSEKKKNNFLRELKELDDFLSEFSFSFVFQKKPLGDGHAILQTAKLVGEEPFAVLFGDDIIDAQTSSLEQILRIFRTCQKPVVSLYNVSSEKLSSYGVVRVEKISNRLFKIKEIIEKPSLSEAPSNLAIVGKYILTPEVFDYLKKLQPDKDGEIRLAGVLDKMIKDGKMVYGYELKGRWLECGNKIEWLKSHLFLSLKHPQYGPILRKFLEEII